MPRRPLTLAVCLAACAACPAPRQSPAAPPTSAPPPLAAAALVPADAPLVLLARDLSRVVLTLRSLAGAAGRSPGGIDRALRRDLGLSLIAPGDLRRAGIALQGSAALYGSGLDLTLVLPVKDPARLRTFANAPAGGESYWVWREAEGRRISLALVGKHLLANVTALTTAGDRADGQPAGAWLGETVKILRGQRPALAGPRLASWLERVGAGRDLVGALQPLPLNRASSMLGERLGQPRDAARCDALDHDLVRARLLLAGLQLGDREAGGTLRVDLDADTRGVLAGAAAHQVTLPAELWDHAPARVRMSVPYREIAQLARRIPHRPGCGAVSDLLAALDPRETVIRMELLANVDGRVAAALTGLAVEGDRLRTRGAALAPPPRPPASRLLALLLAGPWARQERVAGRTVHRVSAPAFLSGTLRIRLDRWMRLTIGEGVMQPLVDYNPPRDGPPMLLAARLEPGPLDLDALARSPLAARFRASELLAGLARFRLLALEARLAPHGLRVDFSWRLARRAGAEP